MTWVTFTRDYRHSTTRYTEYFNEGENRNLPHALVEKICSADAGIKEGRKIEKQRKNEAKVSKASSRK